MDEELIKVWELFLYLCIIRRWEGGKAWFWLGYNYIDTQGKKGLDLIFLQGSYDNSSEPYL
jgi:hypothetical protein